MGPTSIHNRWIAGSSDVLECRDVLRCVLLVTQYIDKSQFMLCQLRPTYLPWDYPSQAWLLSLLRDRFLDLSCNR